MGRNLRENVPLIGTRLYILSNPPGYDLICNCDTKEPGAIDVGVLTSKDQLPVLALHYGDDNYRYQWKKYDLGDLVCQGKQGTFSSEEKNEAFLKLKTEIDEARVDIDYLNEKNGAFKYTIGSYKDAVRQGEIVNFNTPVYGTGVVDGKFSAPIGINLIFNLYKVMGEVMRRFLSKII